MSPSDNARDTATTPDDVVRVGRFVKQAQTLGFTLDDIEQLLKLAAGSTDSCRTVGAIAAAKIDELDRRIAMLRAMRGSLVRLVATCDRPRARRECPLLARLERATSA